MSRPPRTIKPGQERPGSRRTPFVGRVVIDHTLSTADEYTHGGARVVGTVPVAQMSSPAQCARCRSVYDLGHVTVTARYADCDMWKAPCCGMTADSRPRWGGRPGEHNGYRTVSQ